jgi:hypothetical protein
MEKCEKVCPGGKVSEVALKCEIFRGPHVETSQGVLESWHFNCFIHTEKKGNIFVREKPLPEKIRNRVIYSPIMLWSLESPNFSLFLFEKEDKIEVVKATHITIQTSTNAQKIKLNKTECVSSKLEKWICNLWLFSISTFWA